MAERVKAPPNKRATTASGAPATDGRSRSLWFDAPIDDPDRRPQLTRQRVVTEALAVIAQDGAQAMSMRALAARLRVVPGALYHHFGNKQQLQDLVLDGVLAEVDFHTDPALAWTEQLKSWPPGCVRSWRPILGSPGSSRPATRSAPTPWPSPRRSCCHCRRPGSLTARPAWPSSCWSTTPSASRSAALVPPSTSSGSATRRLEPSCTSSSVRCPPTASQPWSPSASTSGSTTATSGSPPASRCWSTGWSMHGAPPTGRRSEGDQPRPPGPPEDVNTHSRQPTGIHKGG